MPCTYSVHIIRADERLLYIARGVWPGAGRPQSSTKESHHATSSKASALDLCLIRRGLLAMGRLHDNAVDAFAPAHKIDSRAASLRIGGAVAQSGCGQRGRQTFVDTEVTHS